jgi:hypothetical protein
VPGKEAWGTDMLACSCSKVCNNLEEFLIEIWTRSDFASAIATRAVVVNSDNVRLTKMEALS